MYIATFIHMLTTNYLTTVMCWGILIQWSCLLIEFKFCCCIKYWGVRWQKKIEEWFPENIYYFLVFLECETPNPISDGSLSISSDGMAVFYTCNSRYSMVGASNITCQEDGTGWDNSQPTCGIYFYFLVKFQLNLWKQ